MSTTPAPLGLPGHVLILEEALDTAERLRLALLQNGFEVVTTAHQPCLVIEQLRSLGENPAAAPPDLILFSYEMTEMNGLELLTALRALPSLENTPMVMMSQQLDAAVWQAAYQAGASEFIRKPVCDVELTCRVRSLLMNRHEMRQRLVLEADMHALQHELQQIKDERDHLASLDALTGIPNRLKFDQMFQNEMQRAVRSNNPLALAVIEISQFQSYLATHGEAAAQQCRESVAHTIAAHIRRAGDLAARYDEETFALLLPDTPPEGIQCVTENIRRAVEALQIPNGNHVVTVSIGATCTLPLQPRELGSDQLLELAQQALTQAKTAGGNVVLLSQPSPKQVRTKFL